MLLIILFGSLFLGLFTLFFISNKNTLRILSLLLSIFTFIVSLVIFIFFNSNDSNYQFLLNIENLNFSSLNINFLFGIDGISIYFIMLTTFLVFLCVIFIWEEKYLKSYLLLLFLLELILLLTFSTLNIILFYIFFEFILFPMFLLIGIWGSREKKIRAAYLLFFYTICGSLPMLFSLFYMYNITGTFDLEKLNSYVFTFEDQLFFWLAFFLSFATKIPMFPCHIWLPEAHVEAPTIGSVLLAGILLKLGVYGFLRYSLNLFPEASIYFSPLVFTLSIIGVIYASLTAIKQTDLKKIIAYSSIAHMNMVVLGIFSGNIIGIQGAILQSVSHGFVASALFFLIGILYNKYHSRLLHYYSGIVHVMPLYSIFMLFFILSNIAFPGTSSFIGEFLLLLGIFQENIVCSFFTSISVVLSGIYSLWLYNRLNFGNIKTEFLNQYNDIIPREFFILFCLFFFSIVLGILPYFLLKVTNLSVVKLFFIINKSLY
jgi:proton-translocating NADH-quinone oxidoreductase chain M